MKHLEDSKGRGNVPDLGQPLAQWLLRTLSPAVNNNCNRENKSWPVCTVTLQDGNNNAEVRLQRRKCVLVGMRWPHITFRDGA